MQYIHFRVTQSQTQRVGLSAYVKAFTKMTQDKLGIQYHYQTQGQGEVDDFGLSF